MIRPSVALIGGGPSCLAAACHLADHFDVCIYEQGKRVGRKFLVAGNGGFNLTNQMSGDLLKAKYTGFSHLQDIISTYDSAFVRDWLDTLGIPTFIGSSGRVFPEKGIKPVEVLNAILNRLEKRNTKIFLEHTFVGFDGDQRPIIKHNEKEESIEADHIIFGLGGGSWTKTGSNREWFAPFRDLGVKISDFTSSNCGLEFNWNEDFVKRFEGIPLKNIAVEYNGRRLIGEAVITEYGLEGNVIYPLSSLLREGLKKGEEGIKIDAKPNSSLEDLLNKINKHTKPKEYGYLFKVSKPILQLAKQGLTKEEYLNPYRFAEQLKRIPLQVNQLRPIDEAISTVGGIDPKTLNADLALVDHPNIHLIGEMIDWDAPTGGFLLQGCFSMGFWVADELNKNLRSIDSVS